MKGKKLDQGKLSWAHFPWKQAEDVMKIFQLGSVKYEWENYLKVPCAEERYLSACFRHLIARAKGERLDPESHEDHYSHAACNLLILLHLESEKEKHAKKNSDICGKKNS